MAGIGLDEDVEAPADGASDAARLAAPAKNVVGLERRSL
jgi:hypothetical protein